jgi:hypothetical protein
MRHALQEAQEKIKERRRQHELQLQKQKELLSEVKVHLIEALANHGDSLTHVKSDEHINLILTPDRGGYMIIGGTFGDADDRPRHEIISVQKSLITDYKAGRLTLDGFRQKVLQYND